MAISARQEVLEAFRRLERRTGERVFRLRDVVKEVMDHTTAYTERTIRTYVTSVMCADAPVHHVNHTDDLQRVGHGQYARITGGESPAPVRGAKAPAPVPPPDPETAEADRPWYWEGHVQAAVVSGLVSAGWDIQAVADTSTRAAGTDIVANRDGTRLHVEVKGYPTTTYARGTKKGQLKPTHPATQARVWFSGALMKAAMLRNDHPDDSVAIGLPAFETYQTLASRVSFTLERSDVAIIWVVDDTGAVDVSGLGNGVGDVPRPS